MTQPPGQPPEEGLLGLLANWLQTSGLLGGTRQPAPPPGAPRRPVAELGAPPLRPVPPAVCAHCPICQGAAAIDSINPDVLSDLTNMAQDLLTGLTAAMGAAAEHRTGGHATASETARPADPATPQRGTAQAPDAPTSGRDAGRPRGTGRSAPAREPGAPGGAAPEAQPDS